jgi:UDP-3-O-[3-hydroxymyristoyl] glucosamine N-acyltransferase
VRASELAALTGGQLFGEDRDFSGVAPLASAGPDDAAFSVGAVQSSRACVVLAGEVVPGTTTVVVRDPRQAFAILLDHLFPETHPPGVQAGAHVETTARVHPKATVYAGAYVGAEAEIGAGAVIFPNAVVLAGSRVGPGCRVGPGAVVGYAGFAVIRGPEGVRPLPQVGKAVLEEGSCVGANSCVDRAFLEETVVGARAQLDNLVQVGHNCRIGQDAVLVAQTGLSGSVIVEDGAVLGGQVGVADHVRIGRGAQVGARSGVHRDLVAGQRYLGLPAEPASQTARVWAASKELPELLRAFRRLERRVEALERSHGPHPEHGASDAPARDLAPHADLPADPDLPPDLDLPADQDLDSP